MTTCAHLWAVGFDDMGWAAKARDAIDRLAREQHDFKLLDVAMAVRYPDGSLTLNGAPFPCATKIHQRRICAIPCVPHARRAATLGGGRRRDVCQNWCQYDGGWDHGRFCPGRGGSDQTRNFCTVCPGRRSGYRRDTGRDPRNGRDGAQNQRGP